MRLIIPIYFLFVTQAPPAASQPVTTSQAAKQLTALQQAVVADFVKSVAANEDYDARGRAFVKEAFDKRKDSLTSSFINESLSILSPAFRAGLELMENDRIAEAADIFSTLSEGSDPYLAVASANQAAAALVELEDIERCETLLDRVAKAHAPIDRHTLAADHFTFMLGYCQRLRLTAEQILTELERRSPGRLGDVRDLMALAGRRMRRGDAGDDVLKPQEDAVAMLNKLIDEAKEQENSKSNSSGGGSSSKSKQGGAKGSTPSGGATRSTLPGGESREGELRKTRARPGAEWGKMPPKQREQILQSLQREFPGRYRELLEQYYESLAKDASSK